MKIAPLAIAAILAATPAFGAQNGDTKDDQATLAGLKTELANLWDWSAISKEPLDVQIISSKHRDGYIVDAIYLNGTGDAAQKDRIFFYYTHPEKPEGKIPALIDLTGGSPDEDRCLYFSKVFKCAAAIPEWRCKGAKLKSKWVGGTPPEYRGKGPLKQDQAYRLISGARRILDYLCAQDYVDQTRLASMGGSMGGIYTLLLAGVDSRISAGVCDVGVGHLANSDCLQGVFYLSPERKDIWLKAFDPYSHAKDIKAKMIVLPSSDDHFCALPDIIETYKAIPTEKRICIDPNFDHSMASFGGPAHYPGLVKWLPYCFGETNAYIKIPEYPENTGNTYRLATGSEEVKDAWLYWSPGGKEVVWQARYWVPVSAKVKDGICEAQVPAEYANLPMYVFMDVYNSKGEKASTFPVFKEGTASDQSTAPLWDKGAIWDVKSGLGAWRPIIWGTIPRTANIQCLPPAGLRIGPAAGEPSKSFLVLTNSIGLASASAPKHPGLSFEIDGNGAPGELKVTLVRNFNTSLKKEEVFAHTIKYEKGAGRYDIPWADFVNAGGAGSSLFPFDTLKIEGVRKDGSQLTISSIGFMDKT